MIEDYYFYADKINRQFEKAFEDIFKTTGRANRAKLLPCLANLYRRWYYSSMLENTFLTPANLFESLNRQYGRPAELCPNVHLRTPVNYKGLRFSFEEYSRNNHPVAADFRTLINFCQPDIDLLENDRMPDDTAQEAAKLLHMNDPAYAAYLLALAFETGILTKIPSIHANRAQLSRKAEKLLSLKDEALFDLIVSSSLRYASRSLCELIPLPAPLFDEEYLLRILQEPVETDAIFQRLYDTIGVDIEDLIGLDVIEELDMLDMAVISGTYLLGLVMDKFFLTPFGHYLKMIRPIYMLPFDFENEISIYLDSYIEEDDLAVAFYAPCSRYFLTGLGLEYFSTAANEGNYLDIENKLNFKDIAAIFDNKGGPVADIRAISKVLDRETCVYTLKVKYLSEPKLWLNIDVSDITNLHRLYLELAYYFDLDKNGEYSFFPDESENPFMAYASPNQPRRAKKAGDTTLASLTLEEKQTFILAVNYPRIGGTKHKEKWIIEVLKIQEGKPGQTYPAVTRLGKALREYFEWQ